MMDRKKLERHATHYAKAVSRVLSKSISRKAVEGLLMAAYFNGFDSGVVWTMGECAKTIRGAVPIPCGLRNKKTKDACLFVAGVMFLVADKIEGKGHFCDKKRSR